MNLKLIFLLITILFFKAPNVDAQGYKWDWAANGLGGSIGGLVTTDHLGNVFLTGTPNSHLPDTFGRFILNPGNERGIIVSKYDASGNILWADRIMNDSAFVLDINVDQYNTLYLFGYYTGQSITIGQYTLFRQDTGVEFFFAKYSQNGNAINAFNIFSINSTKELNGNTWFAYGRLSSGNESFCIKKGKIYLTLPYLARHANIGPFTFQNVDTPKFANLLIAKLDTTGNVLWAKNIDSRFQIFPTGISVTNTENICLSGYFFDTSLLIGNTTLINTTSIYGVAYFLAKFDSSGHSAWVKSLDGNVFIEANHAVTTDIEENVFAVGSFDTVMTCDNKTLTGSATSLFLAKYDPQGILLWLKKVTDSGAAHGVVTDACGNVWVSGASTDFNTIDGHHISPNEPGQYSNGYSMFLAAWTTEGRYVTSSILQSGDGEVGTVSNIAADETGNIYLGSTYGGWDHGCSFPYKVGRSTLFDSYFDSIAFYMSGDFGVGDVFVAKFKADTAISTSTICLDKNTFLNAPDGYLTYLWKDGSSNITHPADSFGANWVMSISSCKYDVNIDTFIVEQCNCQVFVPNAFTPNNDGRNDYIHPLFPNGCIVTDYKFAIYNRWGQQVFDTQDPKARWDGNFKGLPQDLDTYFYYLEYKTGPDKKSYFKKGDITLIR